MRRSYHTVRVWHSMSLRRISVSSLTEARAATKSVLRAGKYRVQETSRDLWTRTKVPLAQGKRKSKELVDLSADLISSLSIRVQKKLLHSRHQQHSSFSPRESRFHSPLKSLTPPDCLLVLHGGGNDGGEWIPLMAADLICLRQQKETLKHLSLRGKNV